MHAVHFKLVLVHILYEESHHIVCYFHIYKLLMYTYIHIKINKYQTCALAQTNPVTFFVCLLHTQQKLVACKRVAFCAMSNTHMQRYYYYYYYVALSTNHIRVCVCVCFAAQCIRNAISGKNTCSIYEYMENCCVNISELIAKAYLLFYTICAYK